MITYESVQTLWHNYIYWSKLETKSPKLNATVKTYGACALFYWNKYLTMRYKWETQEQRTWKHNS